MADVQRMEAARQAVRAVASAFKSIRLYSVGHALAHKGIDQAVTLLKAYVDRYGPLTIALTPQGVTVEFSPQPIEDEIVSEFARALRAGLVRTVRVLGGVSSQQLGGFLHVLMPQQHTRHGGASNQLREEGIDSLLIEDLGTPAIETPAAVPPVLLHILPQGPEAIGERLLALSGADAQTATHLLRDLDRVLTFRARGEQETAYRVIAAALLGTTRFHDAIQREVVRALDEPFAISIASQWPAFMLDDLATAIDEDRTGGRAAVVAALGAARPQTTRGEIPVEAVASQEIQSARTQLVSAQVGLRTHALSRLVELLPLLDARRCGICLHVVEREFSELTELDDQVTVLVDLAGWARSMDGARADLVREALHRILSTQVRDRLALAFGQTITPGHPLERLAIDAPDETVLLLLDLMAEETRLAARREIVEHLQRLARGHVQLLAQHLVDPRWYIARNVATVLGATEQAEAVPYLRAAVSHADARVRKEALHALAQIRTPEAIWVMTQALQHPDSETQKIAAHWLGMTGSPDAAGALVTLLRASPLHEHVEVKRIAIRSLGRLATPEAVAELQRIRSAGGLFNRKQIEELKTEAAQALAASREVRP